MDVDELERGQAPEAASRETPEMQPAPLPEAAPPLAEAPPPQPEAAPLPAEAPPVPAQSIQPQRTHTAQMPDTETWALRESALQEARAERERLLVLHKYGHRAYVIYGWALVVLLIAQVVFPIGIGLLLNSLAPWIVFDMNLTMVAIYGSMYLLGFPLLLLLISDIPDRMPSRPVEADLKLGLKQILALYAMLSAVSTIVVSTSYSYFGQYEVDPSDSAQELLEGTASPWLMFVLVVIVAPVMEEIVFRLLPYRKLGGYGMRYYVIWTSLAFGLFHLDLVQGVYAGIMGGIFAVVMYRTGSVKYSMLLHFLVNLTSGYGLGRLVLNAGDTALTVYSVINLIICCTGFVLFIRYLHRKFFTFKDPYEKGTLQSWRGAFVTGGYILFVALCVIIIVGLL